MHSEPTSPVPDEATTIQAARRRLRLTRWYLFAAGIALYMAWDLFDEVVLVRFNPVLGGFVIDWSVIAALGIVLTWTISHWEDRQLARIENLTIRIAAAERATIQLEATRATARTVAHMINQPLAIVRGYAELLRDTLPTERAAVDLECILRETDRAAAIVRQLLNITEYKTTPYPGGAPMVDLSRTMTERYAEQLDPRNRSQHQHDEQKG